MGGEFGSFVVGATGGVAGLVYGCFSVLSAADGTGASFVGAWFGDFKG